ncbi:inhibitor of nuclear factor kappa-B kinase-interacting protein-like [Gastrophryne carolinensis]
MSSDVKQRKKGGSPGSKEAQRGDAAPGQRAQHDSPKKTTASDSLFPDLRTLLCCLCLAVCAALTWIVLQQSHNFTLLEQKYQSLQSQPSSLEKLEAKVRDISGKLVSTDDILAEATTSSSLINHLQQQVSSLHSDINHIQTNEQALSKTMQSINLRFQNVTDTWKKSLDELNLETSSMKSEAKAFHQQMTSKINSADQSLKSLSEKLKEFEDSTPRNFRMVKKQEDDEVLGISKVLDYDEKAVKDLQEQQDDLANVNQQVRNDMAQFEQKLSECLNNVPVIDSAVVALLKVSKEMLDLDKRVNELTVQVFNAEDNLLKVISETLQIQHAFEGMQLDNSLLKMQNEISVLKDKTHTLSSAKEESVSEKEPSD